MDHPKCRIDALEKDIFELRSTSASGDSYENIK